MRWWLITLASALWFYPTIARADGPNPPLEAVPAGDDKIVPIARGQAAPFEGQLFEPMTALRWANFLQQYKYRLEWDVKRAEESCAVETHYRDVLLTSEEERAQKVEDDLRWRLSTSEIARLAAEEAARNPPWYSSMEFGMAIGAVAAIGVFALSVWAVGATAVE